MLTILKELTFPSDEFVTFRCDQLQQQYYHQACQPTITRVSRRVRKEALPLYYQVSNFVLHTAEGPKFDDALRWLRCNREHLDIVRKFSIWIRQIPQGALSISISRRYKGDRWRADSDWKWITVTRRPAAAEKNAKYILDMLDQGRMLSAVSEGSAIPEDYMALMTGLRTLHVGDGKT